MALGFGVPNFRWITTPRVGQGSERVAQFIDQIPKALMDPLTAKELESGLYSPPPDPRICFTGTLDDAQTFLQKTSPIASCKNCPIAQWTDGIPVVVPTEEKVKDMLTGTSHRPEEYIVYTSTANISLSTSGIVVAVKKGDPRMFLPMSWGTTVEKIAVNAVMAGCKSNYLPVVLASADTGLNYTTTNGGASYTLSMAGPIVKQLGINSKQPFQLGNIPLMTIGRAYDLMMINIGGAAQGSSNTNLGSPGNRTGMCVAEDADSLPPGWEPDNTMGTYVNADGKSTNLTASSSIVRTGGGATIVWCNTSPQAITDLNQGKGPLARSLGVEGKPGKYNILQYFLPPIVGQYGPGTYGGWILTPGVAKSLYDYGFTTKAAVSAWIRDNTVTTIGAEKRHGWWDFQTSGQVGS